MAGHPEFYAGLQAFSYDVPPGASTTASHNRLLSLVVWRHSGCRIRRGADRLERGQLLLRLALSELRSMIVDVPGSALLAYMVAGAFAIAMGRHVATWRTPWRRPGSPNKPPSTRPWTASTGVSGRRPRVGRSLTPALAKRVAATRGAHQGPSPASRSGRRRSPRGVSTGTTGRSSPWRATASRSRSRPRGPRLCAHDAPPW